MSVNPLREAPGRAPARMSARMSAHMSFGLCTTALCGAALAAPERYELDPEHAAVAFLVEHIGYAKAIGRFDDVRGSFVHDADTGEVSELHIVVATASVDTGHEARDEHLRKADFLDVGKHPEMAYTASGTVTDGEGTLDGELELLGERRPLALDVTLNKAAEYPFGHGGFTLGVSARGALARSDWGMDYGVADALVGDAVEILIEVEAIRE